MGLVPLAEALALDATFTRLNLSHCGLTDSSMEALERLLAVSEREGRGGWGGGVEAGRRWATGEGGGEGGAECACAGCLPGLRGGVCAAKWCIVVVVATRAPMHICYERKRPVRKAGLREVGPGVRMHACGWIARAIVLGRDPGARERVLWSCCAAGPPWHHGAGPQPQPHRRPRRHDAGGPAAGVCVWGGGCRGPKWRLREPHHCSTLCAPPFSITQDTRCA